ncbi:MAG: 50S ribosomal protein L23 [Thermaerobacter sp.]|nr:50S ribosomal protein L23 [Thermaerobacter sp.]
MSPYDILKRPIITEASTDAMKFNKYTFEVDARANKVEIRRAVEEIFHVKVTKVNTMWVPGKTKRRGYAVGRTPDRKKAIVTLAVGDSIELIEGV